MKRHRTFALLGLAVVLASGLLYLFTSDWPGWPNIYLLVSKGDNLPIAGLLPLIVMFTYLSLSQAWVHDRLIHQGRRDEVLDEMWK